MFTFVVDQDKASKQEKMENVSIYSLIDDSDAASQALGGAQFSEEEIEALFFKSALKEI